jgi:hypothetical protein
VSLVEPMVPPELGSFQQRTALNEMGFFYLNE